MPLFGEQKVQYLAAFTVSILTTTVGYVIAWPSTILEKLEAEDSPIGAISLPQKSWISSITLFGLFAGNFVTGLLMDFGGRRGLLLLTTGPILMCWLMIYFAKSFTVLLLARFLIGFLTVIPSLASVVYISEISEPAIRGKLGMANMFMIEIGMVLVTTIGCYSTYYAVALVGAAIPVIFYILFCRMPESPYYYLRRGDTINATKSLSKLRMKDAEYVKKELEEIDNNLQKQMANKGSLWEVLTARQYRKPLIIGLGTAVIRQLSGTVAVNSYMKTIFNQVKYGIDPRTASIICTSISVPSVFLGSHLIDKMGRKPLYCISVLGCTVALFTEFAFFFMQNYLKLDVTNYSSMPFIGILIFNVCKVLGIQTLPNILLSELFPTNAKGWGIGICMAFSNFLSFFVSISYPIAAELWGVHYCFLFFGTCCILGLLFIIFVIPETKGQTLHGIQNKLEAKLNNGG